MSGGSWRDRALVLSARYGARPFLALPLPWTVQRLGMTLAAPRPLRAPGIHEAQARIAGLPCLTVAPEKPAGTLVWLHGGAFVIGSPRNYRSLAHGLAARTGYRVILPDYRLAPEHPFPAGLEDCVAVLRAVAADGPFALGGDSAGGTLALAALGLLLPEGVRPTHLVLASPACDLRPDRAAPPDCDEMLLPQRLLRRAARDYLAGADPTDPRASPIRARFAGAPPVLIQAARGEYLERDADAIAARLREFGAPVRVEKEAGVPHVWQLAVGRTPKADRAVDAMAAFLRT
ncbi:alpha/beta hydrolase fold domain-containing protein [Jannaschia ovalis]|uniref:Alpha/beta hydrolase fold domain-containing protein n=1 Tax=Jannaschia ovalis TaxID=3038773 RepID=A0ABY8LC11_9RHOB|nr:alpha/beta hydrolase fold domain-containing protein [Jannaschia sp. GRR-S6-38]WGH78865.1 alpha/beta hydrolase fold domain-containing protein [Jannaschia sp. GRR-S6-38]